MIKYLIYLAILLFASSASNNLRRLGRNSFPYVIKTLDYSDLLIHHIDVNRSIRIVLEDGDLVRVEENENLIVKLVQIRTFEVELKAIELGKEDFVLISKKYGRTVVHFQVDGNEENDTTTFTEPSIYDFDESNISVFTDQVFCLKFSYEPIYQDTVRFRERGYYSETKYLLPITEMGGYEWGHFSSSSHCFFVTKSQNYGLAYDSAGGPSNDFKFEVEKHK